MNTSYARLLPCLFLLACSGAGGGGFDGTAEPDAGTTPGSEPGGETPGSPGADDSGAFEGVFDAGNPVVDETATTCAEATEFVYLIDRDNRMFKYDPTVQSPAALTLIGTMGCQVGGSPNSMAVGRDGFAYVLYGEHGLLGNYNCFGVHKVDIKTAACAGPTPFQCGSAGFKKFGMGFATDLASGDTDSLYLSNAESPALGRVNMGNGSVLAVGALPGGAEFTGNAKGELWGFFPDQSPPAVLQLDKNTGAPLSTIPLAGLPNGTSYGAYAFAFANWGGSFYIFYYVDGLDDSTNVWKLDADGTLVKLIANVGPVIVGAGVSTCAPVEPPK